MRHSFFSLVGAGLLCTACIAAPPQADISSFEDCAAAGYPIMESYPEQCRTPDGRTFTRNIEPTQSSMSTAQSATITSSSSSVAAVSLPALMTKQFSGSDLKLGTVLADNNAYTRYTITYKSGDLRISGIMNIPKGSGPFPLLILNHGHIDTSIYTNGRGLKREQDYLARQGYAVLHPDFRNHAFSDKDATSDMNFRLGYTEDAINAILAVQAAKLPQIDSSKVGMLGHSMGGGVTLNALVLRPDLIDAAVLFAPVSGDVRDNFNKWTKSSSSLAAAIEKTYGSPEQNPAFWDAISPINYLSRIVAPVVIHHGTADDSVPLAWSENLNTKMKAAGKDVVLNVYENEPHEFITDWPLVMKRTTEFFDKNVKG